MNHWFRGLVLFALLGSAVAQSSVNFVTLTKGTSIKLRMAQTLTSKHAYVGERVELMVAEDVNVGDALLVPKDTRVLGTVHVGKAKEGDKNNPHQVVIQIDYIRLGDRRIPLSGKHSDKGKVDKGKVVATTILFGLSGLLLAMDARTGQINEGAEVDAIVAEDVALPALGPATKVAEETEVPPTTR
jgi:hypothetical protein